MGSIWIGSSATAAVSKFNGRTGDVVPAAGDYAANQITPATETFSNAAISVAATTRICYQTGTMSAPRVVTLPAASDLGAGDTITIADMSGSVDATNYLTITAAGADTINGAATYVINEAYGARRLISDGTSAWALEAGQVNIDAPLTSGLVALSGVEPTSIVDSANLSYAPTLGTGGLTVANTTDSSSTSTGAIITAGGVGIAKKLYVGTTANIAGVATLANATDATNTTTAGTVVTGGIGVAKAAFIGGLVNVAGVATLANTTDSSSSTTGGTIISGGLGVAKKLYVGTTANVAGVATLADTTDSSSSTTGGTIISGGLGVAKKLYVGTTANVAGVTTLADATDSSSSTTGGTIISGGVGIAKKLFVGDAIRTKSTTTSTTVATGALVSDGGLGVAGTATIGGAVTITDTTASTSKTSGSAIVGGGLGVAGALFVGGGVNFESYAKIPTIQTVPSAAGSTAVAATAILVDVTGSTTHTITLPASATNAGRIVIIKNSSTGDVTVSPDGSDTIDGAASSTHTTMVSVTYILNGANWTKN